ncbi:MAG: hypothetical protein RL354_1110 [Planctomycetota bacterium]
MRRITLLFQLLLLAAAFPCPSAAGAIGFEAAAVVARQSVPGQRLLAMRERTRNGVWVYECDLVDVPPTQFTTATIHRDNGSVLDIAAIAIPPDEFAATQQAVQRLNYARADFAQAMAVANARAQRTAIERIDLLYEGGILAYRVSYFDAPILVEVDSITGGVIPALIPGLGIEPTVTVAEMAGAIAHAEWVIGLQWRAIEGVAVQRFDGVTVKVLLANRLSGQLMRVEVVQGFLIPSGAFVALGGQAARAAGVAIGSPVICRAIDALSSVQQSSPELGVNAVSLEARAGGAYEWAVRLVDAQEVEADALLEASVAASRKSPQFVAPIDFPPGDVSRDGVVNAEDLALILGSWGAFNPLFDVNESGLVDAGDIAAALNDWTY